MAVIDVHGTVAGRSHRHLEGTVGRNLRNDPGQVAVLLGGVAVGRVDHVANLQAGLLGGRAGVDLNTCMPLPRRVSDRLLVDAEITPLHRRCVDGTDGASLSIIVSVIRIGISVVVVIGIRISVAVPVSVVTP